MADRELEKAKLLISKRKKEHVEAALEQVESALELRPHWEDALELKARILLYLRKFKDVIELLRDHLPSLQQPPQSSACQPLTRRFTSSPQTTPMGFHESQVSTPSKEKCPLIYEESGRTEEMIAPSRVLKCRFSVTKLRHALSRSLSGALFLSHAKAERQKQWRWLVLGQACFHLGMLDDAMALLQRVKKYVSDDSRRQSNGMREDIFCMDTSIETASNHPAIRAEWEQILHMLSSIKSLMRRRSVAIAALEAGIYEESVRHFSKIIDNRKGNAPQGFIADCYLYRAVAYQAMGRVVDAIADCNRSLVLSPHCSIQALSVRASLYEMVRCYSDCLLDLQQLKMIYEASLRYQSIIPELIGGAASPLWQPHLLKIDFAGGLEYINNKIATTRQRLSSASLLDAFTILDMPRNCSMEDVEKAYLLISLKHQVDKELQFIDKRDLTLLQDQRDPEIVKEEARASAVRLSQLIHKAYVKVLSSIAQDETDQHTEMSVCSASEEEEEEEEVGKLGFMEAGLKEHMFRVTGYEKSVRSSDADKESDLVEEEDNDLCDFCQPFGGFSSSKLANLLSYVLSTDLPLSSFAACPADWSLPQYQPQPLPVT
ncbi:hypothetical protein KP509_05G087000 [Ceratopteris richardii]|nr:hypothetical protein KP509_05G087000 [Ceratopteris richardii]